MYFIKVAAHKVWKKLRLPKRLQIFIMKFSQDTFLVGVTGIILNKDKEIMLFKHTYRDVEWSLPGGYVKAKEHPKDALIREIKEESNLDIIINKRLLIWSDKEDARIDIPYLGEYKGGKFKASPEVSEVGFFSPSNLPPLFKAQKKQIIDVVEKEKLTFEKSRKDKIKEIFWNNFRI